MARVFFLCTLHGAVLLGALHCVLLCFASLLCEYLNTRFALEHHEHFTTAFLPLSLEHKKTVQDLVLIVQEVKLVLHPCKKHSINICILIVPIFFIHETGFQ
jgi:hypothetical protein